MPLACSSLTPTPKKKNMVFLKGRINIRDYVDSLMKKGAWEEVAKRKAWGGGFGGFRGLVADIALRVASRSPKNGVPLNSQEI